MIASSHPDSMVSCSTSSGWSGVSLLETDSVSRISIIPRSYSKDDIVTSTVMINDFIQMTTNNDLYSHNSEVLQLPGLSKYTGFLDQSFCNSNDFDHIINDKVSLSSSIDSDYSSPLYHDAHSERCGSFM